MSLARLGPDMLKQAEFCCILSWPLRADTTSYCRIYSLLGRPPPPDKQTQRIPERLIPGIAPSVKLDDLLLSRLASSQKTPKRQPRPHSLQPSSSRCGTHQPAWCAVIEMHDVIWRPPAAPEQRARAMGARTAGSRRRNDRAVGQHAGRWAAAGLTSMLPLREA